MQGDNASRHRSKLTMAQRALLERRIKASAAPSKGLARIAPRSPGEPAPLSFSQHRLWFLDQLQPGDPAYNMLAIARFHGPFEPRILERAINEIIDRHEVLRTRFVQVDGQPLQIVDGTQPFRLEVAEVTPGAFTESDLAHLAKQEATESFDLINGPLFRLRAFRISGDEHLAVMTMHHIISDGWSMRILAAEIRALYVAFAAGLPSPLARLPVQYADYAAWQRAWLTGKLLQGQLEYWKQTLSNAPHLELPTDRVRPPLQTSNGASVTIEVPEQLTSELLEFSRASKVTLFMTLLAGFKILLSSWTGQKDIVVGTPIAGRNDPEIEGLIGFFVNNLVLRTDLSGDPSFIEVLERVREVTLGAYAHQDVPFEKLVEVLKPSRDLSRSPIFQVLVNSHELEIVPSGDEDDVFEVVQDVLSEARADAKFDLNLYLGRQDGGIKLKLVYNRDLFHESTIQRLLQRYVTALEALLGSATLPLSSLSLLSASDRECLLQKWNDTALVYPKDRCIHDLFAEQAMKTPEAVAVVSKNASLSYREIQQCSDRLARRLIRLGVGPETVVGVCADRSPDMVVGLLAILKAGGAYLPLDPDYPSARLSYMISDAKVRIVIAADSHEGTFAAAAVVIAPFELQQDAADVGEQPDIPPLPDVSSSNLAYIIYTSGSTGQPKGVMVEHRQVLNYVFGIRKRVPLADAGHFAMLQSLTVGSAITVLFPSLLFGGCLHLIDRSLALDAEAFESYVASHRVDCLKMAPSYLLALMDAAKSPAKLLSGIIVVAGEPLSASLARRVLSCRPDVRLFNHYGTTETTIGVLTCRVAGELADGTTNIPLGQPLANCRIYVLDQRLDLVPIGAVGDIYVAADSLTRGYLGAPALTAERYLPNPFPAGDTGERLYRTGDVGRWRNDGAIEFLGRVDDQLKLRGFRIELGEIEAALVSHEKVREARVLSHSTLSGELQLVAFVELHRGHSADLPDVTRHLKAVLPEYMVPTHYKFVEAMPRTPHGKVDRRALLADMSGGAIVRHEYVAPRTYSEAVLARIWGEILGLDRVGIQDNFFDLGGHSLLATRLVSRIRDEFGMMLPLRTVFDAPTVAGMAGRLSETDEDETMLIEVEL